MNKKYAWILASIILLGVGLRCYQITETDITDFHSWRQADTAAFTRGYLVDTLNPFYPSVDRYPCELRGEPFGRAEAELPLVAWVAALPLAALGMDFPPVAYLRAVSIFFFILTCICLFLLVLRLDDDPPTALLAVLAFTLLPLAIFFTRTIQPDGPSLFFATGFLYHLLRWLEDDDPRQGVLSCVFGALAMILKISNGYLLFPAIYLFISRKSLLGSLKTPKYWAWGVLLLLPTVAWYLHAHQFAWSFGIWGSSGGPSKFATWGLLTSAGTWRKLSARLTFDILTWSGVLLLVVGLTRFRERPSVRLAAAWAGGFVLLVVAALQGNMTHVYYQLPIVLPAALLIAVGIRILWAQRIGGKLALAAAAVVYLLTSYHILIGPRGHWQEGYFGEDVSAGIKEATRLVRAHVEPGEKFISTDRHPALFFNSRRRGWFYGGNDPLGFIGCAGPDAPAILWSSRDRRAARSLLKRQPELQKRLHEVERGKHYSLWRITDWHTPERYLALIGGSSGGRSFDWSCPEGEGLRGFDVYPGRKPATISALEPICEPLGPGAQDSLESPEKSPAPEAKKAFTIGRMPPKPRPEPSRCAPGTWVVGLKTTSKKVIHDLALICAAANPDPAAQPDSTPADQCPSGQLARGVYGRHGLMVDAIGIRCAAY